MMMPERTTEDFLSCCLIINNYSIFADKSSLIVDISQFVKTINNPSVK